MSAAGVPALDALAERLGILRGYLSWRGEQVSSPVEAVVAAVNALGVELAGPDRAGAALAEVEHRWWQSGAPPVVVAWDGVPARLPLRVPADVDGDWEVEVAFESGRRARSGGRLFDLPASDHAWPGGQVHCVREAEMPGGEDGYHLARWRAAGRHGTTAIIAAPLRAWGAPGEVPRRWGVFAPTYALRSPRSGGAGDLGELERLAELVADHRGHYVATLSLLAQFLDQPCQPSPYAPASRLAWNELYLDLDRAPGLEQSSAARAILGSPEVEAERAALAAEPLIDYRRQYRWRRRVLDELAAEAWATPALRQELLDFAPACADYAVFRAVGEESGATWPSWTEGWRDAPPIHPAALAAEGALGYQPASARVHVYAQWAMQAQLQRLRHQAGLYLDLPVGVSHDSYDVWRHRDVFALSATTGAPPDGLFLGGQDWGLPPLHPERARVGGWPYLRAVIAHHARAAAMLRVDHVMGLHRLYWVPAGFSARDGVYLRYPAGELYAILSLESHRHGCALVGEDLGTVPDYVRPALRRHGVAGLHVGLFAMPHRPGEVMEAGHGDQVAALGTHDTATFAGYWRGVDIDDRLELGLIGEEQASGERDARRRTRMALLAEADCDPLDDLRDQACAAAMAACTRELAAGEAHVVLVTGEDLWLEPAPQNVPGTVDERPNWRRPWSRTVEELAGDGEAKGLLDEVARLRRGE